MGTLKLEDFESKYYAVETMDRAGMTGYRIRDKISGKVTLWDTGWEAIDAYQDLKKAFRTSRVIFHALVNEYTFETEEEGA